MGHFKTSIALQTRVLGPEDTQRVVDGPTSEPPTNPQIGQRWNDLVWDGLAWVDEETWRSQQARE